MTNQDDGESNPNLNSNSIPVPDDTTTTTSASQLEEQALRFVTSIRATTKNQTSDSDSADSDLSIQAQRKFLSDKGLSPEQIDQVFKKAHSRPTNHSTTTPSTSDTTTSTTPSTTTSTSPQDAFDLAARQFNDPLNPVIPPATYPKNPMALYYEQQQQSNATTPLVGQTTTTTRLGMDRTRYQVLLSFFRTMSFLMMLGGGLTALMVGLWRHFILPRLSSSFTLRSNQLSHHNKLFSSVLDSLVSFRSESLAPQSTGLILTNPNNNNKNHPQESTPSSNALIPKRGVLKKTVSFKDEVEERRIGGEEEEKENKAFLDKKSIESKSSSLSSEKEKKAVVEGTDVVVSTPTSEKKDTNESEMRSESNSNPLKPIDLQEPLRTSLSNLISALRSDKSSSAIDTPIINPANTTSTTDSNSTNRKATVSEGSDSESDDSSLFGDEDDPLVFDPYQNNNSSSSSKKHSINTSSSSTNAPKSKEAGMESLKASLNSLSNDIQAQHYNALRGGVGRSSGFGTLGGFPTPDKGKNSENGNENKGVEVAQIKAEIRNLKGLLLSRRNFPTYGRPSTPTTTATTTTTSV